MKITVDVADPKRLKNALSFSYTHVEKVSDSLQDVLARLLAYGTLEKDRTLYLSNDFVENSFNFSVVEDGNEKPIISGGIICHGQGVETFSVTLSQKKGVFFQIHT